MTIHYDPENGKVVGHTEGFDESETIDFELGDGRLASKLVIGKHHVHRKLAVNFDNPRHPARVLDYEVVKGGRRLYLRPLAGGRQYPIAQLLKSA